MRGKEHIEKLFEKFLDGRTTNAEERELYAWFSSHNVPEEWRELKAMFAWYESGMPEEPSVPSANKRRRPQRLWLGIGSTAAIAASIAIIITLTPSEVEPIADEQGSTKSINIYDGSYVIEHGVRNADLAYIEGDIESLLERADNLERQANNLLAWADI